ncbi:MAG: pilus assembly protein PilM [Deltaproteobacteria bacterium]|nr:pilus assembly protein PilM [Candidatus Anaeroferrophillacea bacterium]
MKWKLRKTNRLLAVDIGAGALKLLLTERQGKRHRLLDAVVHELDADAPPLDDDRAPVYYRPLLAEFARPLLSRPARIAGILPQTLTERHDLTLPEVPAADMPSAVYWALKEKLGRSPDIYQRDFFVLDRGRQGERSSLEIRVYLAKQDDVIRFEQLFGPLGTAIEIVEPEDVSLAALLFQCPPAAGGDTFLLVDIGAGGTLLLIAAGGVPQMVRHVGQSTGAWHTAATGYGGGPEEVAALLRTHGVTHYRRRFDPVVEDDPAARIFAALEVEVQQLALEVHRTIDFFQTTMHRGSVDQVMLAGGGALLADLDHYIAETIGVTCRIADPLSCFDLEAFSGGAAKLAELRLLSPRFAAVSGLALRDS